MCQKNRPFDTLHLPALQVRFLLGCQLINLNAPGGQAPAGDDVIDLGRDVDDFSGQFAMVLQDV